MNHRDIEKRCHEDAHAINNAIKRAPETTRNVAILLWPQPSRKGNPPIRDLHGDPRYFSRACMQNRQQNMARTERNISLKGASSPLLKHQTSVH